MKQIKSENYITIQGFMVNELNLKGNELLIYAIIYGFSQLENQEFKGSLQYLADWCNSTKQGIQKNLKSLIEKGHIKKQEMIFNNVKFVSYYATKLYGGMQQSCMGGMQQSCMGGMQQSLPNNINKDNINKDNKKYNVYGEFGRVKLTNEEYQRLCNEYAQSYIDEMINALDEYVESNNNKNGYKNFNTVLRKAIKNNWFNIKQKEKNNDNGGITEL